MNDSTRGLRFSPLAADDETTVRQWLTLLDDAAADVPGAAPPCAADMTGSLRFPPPATKLEDWVVRHEGRGDRVVGALRLALPDGADVARVDQLLVHPELRRRGIGRALYGRAAELAAGHGRSVLSGTVVEALPGGPERDAAPAAFAAAVGARRAAAPAGVHQWLDLGVHDPLASGVPDVPPGYALVTWGTITPDAYAVPVSMLEQSLGDESFDEDEAADQEVATSYAREFETMRVGRGRKAYHTGVLHEASGRLAGYTSVSKTTGNPAYALQGMTVVHRAHRGHRLGTLLKLANLAYVLRHEPAVRLIETANAEDNTAMIAVNADLGFTPADRWTTWTGLVGTAGSD
ncbi:GNAT family N-acetyltransferase [Streptomyces sp. NBC_00198]|uniref:GNAT family N-acetyltransferase n=1 Tax=Streptomyces sp. NBC_00198 TaxID=2975677 RepID=UPI002254BBA1|nr:GNAT family N-acetyltransferase [Streptomyces sp. NBC_00198]MCX5284703.1 GNAT family N-acetyltransferase [Streptomyces sp. NBC_00198]